MPVLVLKRCEVRPEPQISRLALSNDREPYRLGPERAKSRMNQADTGYHAAMLLKIRTAIPKTVVMQYNVVRGFVVS